MMALLLGNNYLLGSYSPASKLQSLSIYSKLRITTFFKFDRTRILQLESIACYSTKEALIRTVLWDISKL